MNLNDFENLVDITNGVCTLLGYLPKVIDNVRRFITKNDFEVKTNDKVSEELEGYLNYKKTNEEKKRCKVILKKHNLPASVGIMCKSENDVCFEPNKKIVDTSLNNLRLQSSDGSVKLVVGGGCFSLITESTIQGIVKPSKIMNGTVIKHKGKIYFLRSPLGGFPNYLAKVELFINGMILELENGEKIGAYYP